MKNSTMYVTGYAERTYKDSEWQGKYENVQAYRDKIMSEINCGDMKNVKGEISDINSCIHGTIVTYIMRGSVDTGFYDEAQADEYITNACKFAELFDVTWE